MPRAGRRPRRRRQTGGQTPETGAQARGREAASVTPPPRTPPSMPPAPATTPPPVQTVRPRRGTPRPTAGAQSGGGGRRGRLYRLTHPRFVMEIIAELRKVVWPSRAETRSLSTVVIVIAIAVGILLGSVDWVFNRLMENVLLN